MVDLATSRCIICHTPHTSVYAERAAMYCSACAVLREDAVGSVTQVLPTLYLGDWRAASRFPGDRLCVYEGEPDYSGRWHHIPILRTLPRSPIDRTGAQVSLERLGHAIVLIGAYVESGTSLIVHCRAGIERSPLTVAWYIFVSGQYPSLDEAYAYLKKIRPVVADRREWLVQ